MAAKFGPILSSTAKVSQLFGANPSYYGPLGFAGHEGVDLAIGIGSPVSAATGGSVLFAGTKGDNYGNYVDLWDADQNVRTLYAHLADVSVKTGDSITEGQLLGHVGNTGRSTNPHLHFGAMRTKPAAGGGIFNFGTFIQTSGPLNPNNGYKGWEDPFDGNLFDWPLIWYPSNLPIGTPPSETGTVGAAEAKFGGLTFDQIFTKYYAGWGRLEAEADFFRTMGGDLNKLLAARGITAGTSGGTTAVRPAALKKKYPINPQFVGLTLNKINSAGIPLGRSDVLATFLGISPDSPFTSGQLLDLTNFPTSYYPSSSEWLGVQKLISKTPIGVAGNYYIDPKYDNMTLAEVNGAGGNIGRSDVLAGFLGISENMRISKYTGFGITGFPPAYIPNSSEWQGFSRVFSQTPPPPEPSAGVEVPEVIPNVPEVPITSLGPTITVLSTPVKAKFYIDGLYFRDLTPANKPYPVAIGKHTVRIEKTDYKTFEAEYDVKENEQLVVSETLEPLAVLPAPTPTPTTSTAKRLTDLEARVTAIEAKIA